MDIEQIIYKHALHNAIKFGKCNKGAVIGKLIAEDPSVKSKLAELNKPIDKIIKEVDKLKQEERIEKLKKIAPELLEERKEIKEKGLELKNAQIGKVVMRFAPSPSGALHAGHSYVLNLNSELCRKYKGKLLLRIEDTNPENIYPDAYKLIPEDAKWLTDDNVAEVIIQSDRLGVYYDHAEKLVEMQRAYVCTCSSEEFRKLAMEEKACPCRNIDKKENLLRYEKMFGEYKPGEAVLRLKTDIHDKNPAMRDFPLMRINDHEHPRAKTKHRVWPLMNLAVAIDDHVLGITHALRAKDHIDNAKRQKLIADCFGWKAPEEVYVGRINFIGMPLSSSETRKMIEYGKYTGWDDPRIGFMPALRRRGYTRGAFVNYALDVGITQNDKTVSKEEFFKALNHFNREAVDKDANRYFAVLEPVEINVNDAPEIETELLLHPDFPKRGKRKFKTKGKFYIGGDDFLNLEENKLHRLMDCMNFKIKDKNFIFISKGYEEFKDHGNRIIHWLPAGKDLVNAEVVFPDDEKTVKQGLGEKGLDKLKVGNIVQLERIGFARLDKKSKDKLTFYFAHR